MVDNKSPKEVVHISYNLNRDLLIFGTVSVEVQTLEYLKQEVFKRLWVAV